MAERIVTVLYAPGYEEEPVSLVEVTVTCGGVRRDVALSRERREMQVAFEADGPPFPPLEYRFRAYLGTRGEGGGRTSFESASRTTDASLLVVDPREAFDTTEVQALLALDPERYRGAFVDVRAEDAKAGWSETQTLELLRPDRERAVARFFSSKGGAVALQHRVRIFDAARTVSAQAWAPLEPGLLVVSDAVAVAG